MAAAAKVSAKMRDMVFSPEKISSVLMLRRVWGGQSVMPKGKRGKKCGIRTQ
jgi:hypothetical protein